MTFTDKKKYAELMVDYVLSGHSFEETKNHFIEEGVSKYDISNMFYKVKKGITDKHGAQIRTYLLDNSFEQNKNKFALHQEVLDYLQESQIDDIKKRCNNEVRRLVKQDASNESIISHVRNRFYSEQDILNQINVVETVQLEDEAETKGGSVPLGILMIVIGGGISLYSLNNPSGGYITYGLVIYGFVILFRGLNK